MAWVLWAVYLIVVVVVVPRIFSDICVGINPVVIIGTVVRLPLMAAPPRPTL